MATCTSELIVSVIGTFLTKSDLGVGTVVGSGVYNTLGVSACVGLATRQAIPLDKWPLFRDSCVYVTSITVLAAIAYDNVVVWYEALIMMVMYFGYFLFLFTQGDLVKKFKNKNTFRSCKYADKNLFVICILLRGNRFGGTKKKLQSQNEVIPQSKLKIYV